MHYSTGNVIKDILHGLKEFEYSCRVLKLKTEQFGVFQRRGRVLIIGYRTNDYYSHPVRIFTAIVKGILIHENYEKFFVSAFPITVEEAIRDLPAIDIGGGSEILEH